MPAALLEFADESLPYATGERCWLAHRERFASAFAQRELRDAVIVNPYDVDGCADGEPG